MAEDTQQPSVPLAEIVHGPSAFEQFLDRNQKNLLVLLVVLILGVVALVVYRGVQDGTRLAAANALYNASDIDALKKVSTEHAGTPAAATASVKLADLQWEKGEKESSIATLRSFLSQSPKHPAAPAARASLAAKLMAEGKTAEAVTAFEEIIDDPSSSYLAPFALLSLGDMALAGGDQEKAKSYYEQAKAEHPTSGFNQRISQRIAGLSATLPVEIDPPAPEPTKASELPAQPTPLIPASQLPTASGQPGTPASDASGNKPATDSNPGNSADQNESTEP